MIDTIKRYIRIPKQRSMPWLGAIIDSLYISLPLVSVINFISIQTVLYTNVKEYLLPWLPWLNFGLFIMFMVCLVMVVMLLAFKYIVPSLWVWRGKQLYGHRSILMDEVKKLRDELKESKEKAGKEARGMQRELRGMKEELKGLKEMLATQS